MKKMGYLSPKVKNITSGCFNYFKGFYIILILLSLINISVCIYEDQIGKFDWRQSYIGKIKFSHFDTVSTAKKIIVATEENVIAALNIKTGEIIWRKMLESASNGKIHLLHVADNSVTVSGNNPYLIRVWDNNSGNLHSEWSMQVKDEKNVHNSKWFILKDTLYHVLPVYGVHLEVTAYQVYTGHNKGKTSQFPAAWCSTNCVLSAPHYSCISGDYGSQLLISMDVTSPAVQLITKPLSEYVTWAKTKGVLRPFDSSTHLPGVIIENKALIFQDNKIIAKSLIDENVGVSIVDTASGPALVQAHALNERLTIRANLLSDDALVEELSSETDLEITSPKILRAICSKGAKSNIACRILITGDDASVHLLQQNGQEVWRREESLSNIAAVHFVGLPVSESEAAIESEFDQKDGDILGKFVRRISTQWHQMTHFLQGVMSNEKSDLKSSESLVRDYFDLHKIIIAVTKIGKVFSLDNLTGEILWSRDIEGFVPISGDSSILERRTARHPPHDALITIVGKDEKTGDGVLVNLNPITGELIEEGVVNLDFKIKQLTLLPNLNAEFMKPLVLLDSDDSVFVMPKSSENLVDDLFMFVADKETTQVQGYALVYDGRSVVARKTWSLLLAGTKDSDHKIVDIAAKNPHERIHSHGKVMNDRSVLYKYINPNLVAFVTEGSDPVHKDILSVFLVDAVSGAIVFAQQHQRALRRAAPVHAQNFLVYAYYNDKMRRTEVATVELYEGPTRSLPPGAPFSSLAPQNMAPMVDRQAYILPATVTSLKDTITDRGITDKDVLFALSSGAIVELPWMWLEPRRGADEVSVPYTPELALPAEAVVSYNTTLAPARHIHTAPSGLESTCLMLAYGLDLFYTRLTPSKTFDLLKDDFDYFLISIVLIGLVTASYVSKYFATRKMLKQAWK